MLTFEVISIGILISSVLIDAGLVSIGCRLFFKFWPPYWRVCLALLVVAAPTAFVIVVLVFNLVALSYGLLFGLIAQAVVLGLILKRPDGDTFGILRGFGVTIFPAIPIAILIIIAIPHYTNEVNINARAQGSDALSVTGSLRNAVSKYRQNEGAWPASNAAVGHGSPEQYSSEFVSAVSVGNGGVITVVMKSVDVELVLAGRHFRLIPTEDSGTISWTCSNDLGDDDQNAVPKPCRRNE